MVSPFTKSGATAMSSGYRWLVRFTLGEVHDTEVEQSGHLIRVELFEQGIQLLQEGHIRTGVLREQQRRLDVLFGRRDAGPAPLLQSSVGAAGMQHGVADG